MKTCMYEQNFILPCAWYYSTTLCTTFAWFCSTGRNRVIMKWNLGECKVICPGWAEKSDVEVTWLQCWPLRKSRSHQHGQKTVLAMSVFLFETFGTFKNLRWKWVNFISFVYAIGCGYFMCAAASCDIKKPQSFWIFDQQHRSMKCSIISNHICQCNLFSTILQHS